MSNPFEAPPARALIDADFAAAETQLANRNHGQPLEALAFERTPVGLHYLLTHFDMPLLDQDSWRLRVDGHVARPLTLSLADLRRLPQATPRVTLECAGNGRGHMRPRYPSMPWLEGGVATADWTGVPLHRVLDLAGVAGGAVAIAFLGADRGYDRGIEHHYGRSLDPETAHQPNVLLCHAMNGAPLPVQHGAPVRLIVAGWYGMASVKWLERIAVLEEPFDGPQQAIGYHYRTAPGEHGTPITTMRVKSLMIPPGVPDWYTRERLVERGRVTVRGRAWTGAGQAITRVELAVDGAWRDAELDPPGAGGDGCYAWRGWRCAWQAEPGRHMLACRAHDAAGQVQPDTPVFDSGGMGNNAVQRVTVWVR